MSPEQTMVDPDHARDLDNHARAERIRVDVDDDPVLAELVRAATLADAMMCSVGRGEVDPEAMAHAQIALHAALAPFHDEV